MNDGGPAYPRPAAFNACGDHIPEQEGMSLRDHFAGQALDGVLRGHQEDYRRGGGKGNDRDKIALGCYMIADAMLAERVKQEEQGS